ncbi:MAG: hypothetical protein AAF612_04855, partial [Planctomycetota bacterium]
GAWLGSRLPGGGWSDTKRDILADEAGRAVRRAGERRGVDAVFEETPWRPGSDRASRQAFHLQFGWWAYHSGERSTAAIYGLKAAAAKPWSIRGWRLAAKAVLTSPGPGSRSGSDARDGPDAAGR